MFLNTLPQVHSGFLFKKKKVHSGFCEKCHSSYAINSLSNMCQRTNSTESLKLKVKPYDALDTLLYPLKSDSFGMKLWMQHMFSHMVLNIPFEMKDG